MATRILSWRGLQATGLFRTPQLRVFSPTNAFHNTRSFPRPPFPPAAMRLGLRSFAQNSLPESAHQQRKPSKLGSLIREYGPLSVAVYLVFSSITFVCCLSSIYFLGVDRDMVTRWLKTAKAAIGIVAREKDARAGDDREGETRRLTDWLPDVFKSDAVVTLGTNILLAMVMTKLFMPLKLTLVAFVTPTLARRLRAMGFNLGQKGGYGSAARNVRDNIRDRRNSN